MEDQRFGYVVIGLENPDYLPPPEPPKAPKPRAYDFPLWWLLFLQIPYQVLWRIEIDSAGNMYGLNFLGGLLLMVCALSVASVAGRLTPWSRNRRARRKQTGVPQPMSAKEFVTFRLAVTSAAGVLAFAPALLGWT